MKDRLGGSDPPSQMVGETCFFCLIRDDKAEVRKSLPWVGEEGLEVLDRCGRGRGGGWGGRGGIQIILVIILDDGKGGLQSLGRALDDGEVGLDLINSGLILGVEDGTVALAGHGLGVEGVHGALGELVDSKDAGLLEAEAVAGTPVGVAIVDVEGREVELGLGDEGHADVSVLGLGHATERLLVLELSGCGCGDSRGRGGRHRSHWGLGLEALLAG